MIVVVDYGMGNLRSVAKAVELVGGRCKVSASLKDIKKADKLILPGVGAFKEAISHIQDLNLYDAIDNFLNEGKPFFGICLGMQLLFQKSFEGGFAKGFGRIGGNVKKFILSGLKVPHMGWNRIRLSDSGCPLFKDVPDGSFMYFAHSYYASPKDKDVIAATTDYGVRFASAVWDGNVFLTQFHPEKSQQLGLRIIRNFVRM